MAKFGSIEVTADDWKGIKELFNSKIGLAFLVSVMGIVALWLTIPRLEAISQNTFVTAQSLQETKRTNDANHELLVRIMEQCEMSQRTDKATQ